MRLDLLSVTWVIVLALTWSSINGDKIKFEDEVTDNSPPSSNVVKPVHEETDQQNVNLRQNDGPSSNRSRQGKHLLDWIGLGTGHNIDPYLAKTNEGCLNGDFAECFKSRALNTFSDFFDQNIYTLNDNVKVVRMPRDVVKEVSNQAFEYSSTARSEDTEWDQMVKFAMRKAERFVKTVAIEVSVPAWLTGENEVYAPRFIDEIADEIDVLENKKDTLFSRHRLRKLLIPMLIVLKLFKLKLLLFLPLILGLASFKKFLGFLAIVVPGLIGFFKLCKPITQSYTPPVYSPSGIGFPVGPYKESYGFSPSEHGPGFISEHGPYNSGHHDSPHPSSGNVNFGQDLAYQGYREYHQ